MEYLAIYVCELACTAIPAFIAFLAYGRLRRRNRSSGASSVALAAVFSAYLFALFHFTGAGTLHDAMRFGMDFNPHQLSLVPFTGFLGDIEGHVLNVLLFVPLGLLVPMVSGTRPDALRMALMAVATSVAIEVSQLLNSRVTDVDDLLMNIIGALLGYGLLTLVSQTRKERSNEGPGIILPTVMIVAAFLGRLLLYDEMGLAKLLFSF